MERRISRIDGWAINRQNKQSSLVILREAITIAPPINLVSYFYQETVRPIACSERGNNVERTGQPCFTSGEGDRAVPHKGGKQHQQPGRWLDEMLRAKTWARRRAGVPSVSRPPRA